MRMLTPSGSARGRQPTGLEYVEVDPAPRPAGTTGKSPMFITKRALPRRTFLRGMGTVVALPFLESMVPATAWAQAAKVAPRRFGACYVPNGSTMATWMPKAAGELEITPILGPLAK